MKDKIDLTREQLEQWCGALMSGEYSQCRGALRRELISGEPFGHCSLGVLAEECGALDEQGRVDFGAGGNSYALPSTGSPLAPSHLEPTATTGPQVAIGGHTRHVAEHNDNGVTFAEIAQALWDQCVCVDDEGQS